MVALLIGIIFGPTILDWLNPRVWGAQEHLLKEVGELTLAIGLMSLALRLPSGFVLRQGRSLAILLIFLMPLMWLSSTFLIYFALGGQFWAALVVGAAIVPTDPIVSTSIVTGEIAEQNLPDRLRHTLSSESGLNDGMAHPLVMLVLMCLLDPTWNGLGKWFLEEMLLKVVGAIAFGTLMGYCAGWLLHWSERKKTIECTSFLAYTLALSIFSLGAANMLELEGLLAVFITGLSFDRVVQGKERAEEAGIQEAVNQFFTLPVFTLFGLMLPWEEWATLGWAGIGVVLAILLLKRLPFLLLLGRTIPSLNSYRDAVYLGWFGPIGVAALYYSVLILERTGQKEGWIFGSLVVFASILLHGITATPLTKWYGKRARIKPTSRQSHSSF